MRNTAGAWTQEMTKKKLQKILVKAGVQENTLEMRLFIPTADEIVYMQVGSGEQLDGDCDEDGTPYDNYIDYKQSEWDDCENCFTEGDGGLFEFVANDEDGMLGILLGRAYDTLVDIYGENEVNGTDFVVQVLAMTA